MEETWEHVSVHWLQGKYPIWANCFMRWMPVSLSPGNSANHCCLPKNLGHDTSVKSELALAVWYHTPGTTTNRLWAPYQYLYCERSYEIRYGTLMRWMVVRVTAPCDEFCYSVPILKIAQYYWFFKTITYSPVYIILKTTLRLWLFCDVSP